MRIIYDAAKHGKKIKKSIRKYGHFAENNFFHYMHCQTGYYRNVFFDYGKDKGLLMRHNSKNNVWGLFPCGVLAPEEERLELLLDAAKFVIKKNKAKKLVVEVSEGLRRDILNTLKRQNSLRVSTYTYVFYWPVYNMDSWDTKLKGSRMKKLRNIRNRFYRKYSVRVKDTKDVPKEKLKKIFMNWARRRSVNDRIDKEYYLKLINSKFKNFYMAKTIYVNGNPATITAGWKMPNSNSYYSAIGIVDYSYPGLGEVANIDDLNRLKRRGFDYVDFGGSDKILLKFKRKFRPERIYKTYAFSIARK